MAKSEDEERDGAARTAAIRAIKAGFTGVLFDVAFRTAAPLYWYRRGDRRAGVGTELYSWRFAGLIAEAYDEWEVIWVPSLWNVNRDGTISSTRV